MILENGFSGKWGMVVCCEGGLGNGGLNGQMVIMTSRGSRKWDISYGSLL